MSQTALDLDAFFAIPRLQSIHLSPDGGRLALTIARVSADGKRMVPAIWEVSIGGEGLPRRLTRSARGETARGFVSDGSLVFTSSRTDLEADEAKAAEVDALYLLPAGGGEPRRLAAPDGGVQEVLTGRRSQRIVFSAPVHPGSSSLEQDAERERERRDAGVQARLLDHYPSRFWDHPIGPREPHLFALDLVDPSGEVGTPRDLTPSPPWAGWLEEVHLSMRDDGGAVALGARMRHGRAFHANLAVLDTESGDLRVINDGDREHTLVSWAPDGSRLAVTWSELGTPERAPHAVLSLIDPRTGDERIVPLGTEAHCTELAWTVDGRALLVIADQGGRTPVLRVTPEGTATRLTSAGAYSHLRPAPDGRSAYAVRSAWDAIPEPVVINVSSADQVPTVVSSPVGQRSLGVRVEEVVATAGDGLPVQSWLVLPEAPAGPFPLAVFVHGGPISAWSAWTWRWCAAVLAGRGWAVLLPNPRLSTGFGYEHIAAAWDDWAELPAGDILAATDAAAAREDIDGGRIAALGGSYGGYMVNWLGGHTDRFAAIVTHASVWDMFMQRGASDAGSYMEEEFGDPLVNEDRWRAQSPHLSAASLHTPTLVIHGERDDRVPIANALSLWTELQLRGVPSRLLVFPDENHWILKPQNSRLWYETVLAFLEEHVLGSPFRRPNLL